jgi:hypothetical protein
MVSVHLATRLEMGDLQEVDEDELESDPAGVHSVQLPLSALPGAVHWNSVLRC